MLLAADETDTLPCCGLARASAARLARGHCASPSHFVVYDRECERGRRWPLRAVRLVAVRGQCTGTGCTVQDAPIAIAQWARGSAWRRTQRVHGEGRRTVQIRS